MRFEKSDLVTAIATIVLLVLLESFTSFNILTSSVNGFVDLLQPLATFFVIFLVARTCWLWVSERSSRRSSDDDARLG